MDSTLSSLIGKDQYQSEHTVFVVFGFEEVTKNDASLWEDVLL